ncbi:DNA-binding transcriptional regulator YbjK [Diaminobutyricimonas aerilata]|uniref:DNA-binding transcriptional regulator YbjK n=1 Tax=Diaminobutyricimonas aerilata TaxID=1162967 RepID=A0A2M9CM45_9MICO|nr:TetR/AcrR family transcriptional regulator [Diaminobutyricimonas aerilata]PJJ72966.1 DNA-binding transcriptional regulator YbjK [Diaminobutyricimonas aerilata]
MTRNEPDNRPGEAASDRRASIADAAIRIVAREGLRSLTHRAVDRELDLPTGSTSYYVRTRKQLIELVVHRLANRTRADLSASPASAVVEREGATVTDAAGALAALLERIAARSDDQLARFALAVDLHSDRELHRFITNSSPIREQMLAGARAVVSAAGAPDVDEAARGLLVVVDGLLFDRLAGSGVDSGHRADPATVIAAYLRGLPATAS